MTFDNIGQLLEASVLPNLPKKFRKNCHKTVYKKIIILNTTAPTTVNKSCKNMLIF